MANLSSKDRAAESAPSGLTWLDCTLRDGGYYNSWDFPFDVIQNYLDALAGCLVDRVELGFRQLQEKNYAGFAAYTPNALINQLVIPPSLKIGVMINASELGSTAVEIERNLAIMVPHAPDQRISFVRLAAHSYETERASIAARILKKHGFEVCLNLMQISEVTDEALREIVAGLDPACADVLYLADSLGSLKPREIVSIVKAVRENWPNPIGVHAHDNGGLAIANTLAAIEAGATWVDSTVTGMGRGAGNTQSEILVGHLDSIRGKRGDTSKLDKLIDEYFLPLQLECRWGVNSHYVRAGELGIHPTYVQELLNNSVYSAVEIDAAITELGRTESRQFSRVLLDATANSAITVESSPGTFDQRNVFADKEVLFLGSGRTTQNHQEALELLAAETDIVVSANLFAPINQSRITYNIACHPLKIIADATEYPFLGNPIIAPAGLIPSDVRESLELAASIFDVGLSTDLQSLPSASIGNIILPLPQVLAYGLLVFLSGGAKRILLSGFDGFPSDDPRRMEEQTVLSRILELDYSGEVLAITPSKLSLPHSSVYKILS